VLSKSLQSIVGIVFGFAIGGLIGLVAVPAAPAPSAPQGALIAAADRGAAHPAPASLAFEDAVALVVPASQAPATPSPAP